MDVLCEFCNAKHFSKELPSDKMFTHCCQKGKVRIPEQNYPELLQNLMNGTASASSNFLEHIRSINSSFAFASMGANVKLPPGRGPYCFRVHGQIMHRIGAFHPEDGEQPKFAQFYFHDPAEANALRLQRRENEGVAPMLMNEIARLLQEVNPFANSYRMLRDVEEEALHDAEENNIPMPNIIMAIKQNRAQDARRYNNPRVNEVAVIFDNNNGEPPFNRDILVHLRRDPANPASAVRQISILDPNLDALVYPLLFPRGEQGWHDELMQTNGGRRVTHMQYYSYKLSVRGTFNPLLNTGKLTQQFFVDAYVKMEANRLNFIRRNQTRLRAESYAGLADHLRVRAAAANVPIGRIVLLPSSFEGSPRNLQQKCQDALAIVTKYGKPDLFITMTCNPKWEEITSNMELGNRAEFRPDLLARVFFLKFNSMMEDLKKGLFGTIAAVVHVIEFQKRGLPHGHVLAILDVGSKIKTSDEIDRVISAEIPDAEDFPELHELVKKHMIHGPCGDANPNCPCMEKGACTKKYPKPLRESTLGEQNGYPLYRRRKGQTCQLGNKTVDNSWVVPHNTYLLKKYNCHINVECCASVKSVKYLYKYVYKGHDCANVEIANHDQPAQHVDARYVSAPEAAWRLFAFPMHKQSHAVIRLPVHLENEQEIYFDEDADEDDIQRRMTRISKLDAYFNLNRSYPDARNYFYRDIPVHFVFANNRWKIRERGGEKVIGRMYSVSVSDQERYYLRILLLHVRGATSFQALRSVNGIEFPNFRDAARALGLLLDDAMWRDTLDEAKTLSMPKQLREMFAYICVFGPPSNPIELWKIFRRWMVEDFQHTCPFEHNEDGSCGGDCERFAMKAVNDILILHRKSYEDFDLPPPAQQYPVCLEPINLSEELQRARQMYEQLNPEQSSAFRAITTALRDTNRHSRCFFIDGPGGSGKTFLYTALTHFAEGNEKKVLAAATTGIAANLLPGGRTMHSMFGIPLLLNESSVSRIKADSYGGNQLRQADLIIIDECTLASSLALNVIDSLLQELMGRRGVPFGGKLIVLGGDFRQCLPVFPHAQRPVIVEGSLMSATNWNIFQRLPLKANMRSEDAEYSAWLLQLGNGTLPTIAEVDEDVVRIPEDMLCSGCLVTEIFGEQLNVDLRNRTSVEALANKAILCPKNDDVDEINQQVMDRMHAEYTIYLSDDSLDADDEEERNNYNTEFLNSLTPSGMPPHRLQLKIGVIIMLLRNLNTNKGLCNGTRLIVISLRNHFIEAMVLTGKAAWELVFIPRIDLCPSDTDLPFKLKRRQFPVKAAFGMTINKAQGQTLSRVGIYLPNPVFGHGQLYVAFSRSRRRSDVRIKVINGALQGKLLEESESIFTVNVVYKEVLTN